MKTNVLTLAAWFARILPAGFKQRLYSWRPLAAVIRRALNRAAPQGLTEIRVAAGGLMGFRLLLDMKSEKDYWLGTYEPELQEAVAHFVKPGMTAYDVGANIGYLSLLLAKAVGFSGAVYAFECLPDNVERLRANVRLNNLEMRVHIIPRAVVDQVKKINFLVGPSGGMGKARGSAGREEITYTNEIEVEALSLDGFVFEQGRPEPQVIKMDIEGGEVLAFPGMQRLLRESPPLLFLELHGQNAVEVAWNTLNENGYRICRMQKGYPQVQAVEDLNWKAYLVALPPGFNGGFYSDESI